MITCKIEASPRFRVGDLVGPDLALSSKRQLRRRSAYRIERQVSGGGERFGDELGDRVESDVFGAQTP